MQYKQQLQASRALCFLKWLKRILIYHLMEISSQALAETHLEAAIREWQLPAPTQCGKEFATQPPPNADAILGPPHPDISSEHMSQLFVCNGVRNFNQRTFVPEIPFAVPISLHYFASNGLVTEPDTLVVQNKRYQLGGCTF